MGKYIGYNWSTMANASFGEHWRNLRRLSALEIFSTSRLESFLSMRRDEVLSMAGASYPGDFLPFFRWIDYKNYKKRVVVLFKEMDTLLQGTIEENRNGESRNSMVDHLLSLQKSQAHPSYYSDIIIKGLMVVLIFGGSDTSGVTIEWAMSLLLNHPRVLKKARDEIDIVIGQDRLVEERSCPRKGLAHRVVGLVLASLIQCFECERISDEKIDLTEGKGLTMPKAEPLEAMCKTRHVIDKVNT
ncbi:hypothetical protein POM88_012503 [Heracleum sosnowskyi]|uniref:Cytochrome P450 n=1 Tax=Heracleum sosnowskyi TaxID=360622 RepID=A0AAD8J023_9APIA|nr:hypothetical protein POM88_012503 [Heracleum sosnowskyi]